MKCLALLACVAELRHRKAICLANIAAGTHAKSVTRLTDAAVTIRYLLAKAGSDTNHVGICGETDCPLGVMTDEASAAEVKLGVELLGVTDRTLLMVASEAIAVGADVYAAASGKVQDEPAVAGTYYKVGRAVRAAAANLDEIEVQAHAPVKMVVVAAFTSTNGTAAAASGSLANLAAEAEKIGDDVRALGAALSTPALVKVLAA